MFAGIFLGYAAYYLVRNNFALAMPDILAEHHIAGAEWRLTVDPMPCLDWTPWSLADIADVSHRNGTELALETLGVLHGSVLTIYQAPDQPTRE